MGNKSISNLKKIIKPIKKEGNLEDIKSKYILIYIFDTLRKNRWLDIIKYNKKLQNKLELDINSYKEYHDIYSEIELEIIPVKKKSGKFIDIAKKK